MIKLQYIFYLAGIILLIVSLLSFRDKTNPKRITTGLFWGLYGLVFFIDAPVNNEVLTVVEKRICIAVGIIVITMAFIAGFKGVSLGTYQQTTEEQRKVSAKKIGNSLFIPALAIPVMTVISILIFNNNIGLQKIVFGQGNHSTIITTFSMALGCIIGLLIALFMTKEAVDKPLQETRRLLDSIGWAFILPQVLATLGLLFSSAGVGDAINYLTQEYITIDHRFIAVALYVLGMAILTMIMGNAFAAFPIITAGIGIPLLIHKYGGNPAIIAAIGMFSGYCGTLMTPMASNFNYVPVILLELPDKNSVIKAQISTALPLLIVNVFLLYFLMLK